MSKSQSIHSVKDTHLSWDNTIPPVQTVRSGDIVRFECVDASNGQITSNSTVQAIQEFDQSRLDQVNGPVYVEGAEPGDVLEIEVLEVVTDVWGWTAIIPGFGLLADEFTEPHLKIWKIERDEKDADTGYAWFMPGIRIPIAPFCGEMGLAPAEPGKKSTIPPYHHGTAIETPIHATVRLTVHKSFKISEPQFMTSRPLAVQTNTAPYYCCTGIDSDMLEATRKAVRNMIEYLQRTKDLSRSEAYMLCSVAVDLKLCEVVDMPNFVVGAFLPMSIFVDDV
ncbi:hypothetical protein Unana1_02909 [Umbelopsis nana]